VFALARDGFLPGALARVHPVYRSPHLAIAVQSSLSLALALSGTFEKLAILANVSVLALYLGCALAAWQLRRLGIEGGGTGTAFRVPFGGVTPWLACAVIAWLLTGLTADEWLGFAICLGLASLPYALTRRGTGRTVGS
jgi:basic amino acid/polyamine antiporter, APA family